MKTATPKTVIIFCCILFFLSAQLTFASNKNIKINRVALFKNGLGYFSSSAKIPKEKMSVNIGQMPIASFGTFWVSYPTNLKLQTLFTKLEEVTDERPVRNLGELLNVNTGKYVTVKIGNDNDVSSFIDGEILKIVPDEKKPKSPNPYFMNVRNLNANYRYRQYNSYNVSVSNLLFLKKKNVITLKISSISRVEFSNDDFKTTVPTKSKELSVNVKLKEPAKDDEKININFLARGITWSPSYLIDISNPKTAKLSAKALVINEVADMTNVHLDLITGFPNIKFAEVNSPIAMSEKLDKFLNALTSGRSDSRNRGGNYMMQQRAIVANFAPYEQFASVPMPEYSTARKGNVSGDLFYYPVDNFTLACGETAYIPLFTSEVPYKHIYTWEIPDFIDKNDQYQNNNSDANGKSTQKIWHCCRLTNNMKLPWTTAAAEFVKNGNFVGQDVCFYTAPGAETTVKINRALNVIADESEIEIERKRKADRFHGWNYDLVKIKGELKIRNRLDKKINIEITKKLSGEVQTTEPKAKDIPVAKGLKQINTRHKIIWNLELQPDENKIITYTYSVYVR